MDWTTCRISLSRSSTITVFCWTMTSWSSVNPWKSKTYWSSQILISCKSWHLKHFYPFPISAYSDADFKKSINIDLQQYGYQYIYHPSYIIHLNIWRNMHWRKKWGYIVYYYNVNVSSPTRSYSAISSSSSIRGPESKKCFDRSSRFFIPLIISKDI